MERCADPITQLQIDEAILDYLLYVAIKTLISASKSIISDNINCFNVSRSHHNSDVDLPLQMVDSFLAMFHAMHPNHHGSAESRLRLRMLRFMSLFMNRFKPLMSMPSVLALQKMRKQHDQDARASHLYKVLPCDLTMALLSRSQVSLKLDPISYEEQTAIPLARIKSNYAKKLDSPSLLDSLPDFMALCAAAHIILEGTQVTNVWMKLAAGYMVQAVIEQFFDYGAQGTRIIQQAFSYGFDGESTADEDSVDFQLNALFFGEDKQVEGWDIIREQHILALIPPPGTSLQDHLEALITKKFSPRVFEQHLIEFLEGLFDSQSNPFLVHAEIIKQAR